MQDPFNLQRFIDAQDDVHATVLGELRAGRKQSHWMWFVFPQIAGLGHSAMSRRYAISGRDEAAAYLHHPILGPRLRECTGLVNAVPDRSAHNIFGSPDDMKFHSCITLFAAVADDEAPFRAALDRFFGGTPDRATAERL